MKKGTVIIAAVVALVLIVAGFVIGGYNNMVKASESVDNKWSQVETYLQRRADLIPNLVNTVKGYAKHESDVFTQVSDARTRLAGATTPEEAAKANGDLTAGLGRLLAIAESYPDLKANTNFIQLQDELTGTENRISTSRKDYNDEVKSYNQMVKVFPTNILAGIFGFGEKTYFEADAGSEKVPNVNFE